MKIPIYKAVVDTGKKVVTEYILARSYDSALNIISSGFYTLDKIGTLEIGDEKALENILKKSSLKLKIEI